MNKKQQLLTYLIELNLLLDLFLITNLNITNKIKDIIIVLNSSNTDKDFSNLLNYDKQQLKQFCQMNIENIMKDLK